MPEEGQPQAGDGAGTQPGTPQPGTHRSEWAPEATDPDLTTRPEPQQSATQQVPYGSAAAGNGYGSAAPGGGSGPAGQSSYAPAGTNGYGAAAPQSYGATAGYATGQATGQATGSADQSPWWVPDAQRDPWRDPGSAPAWLPPQPPTPPAPPPADLPAARPSRQVGLGLLAIVAVVVALLAGSLGGALGYVAASRGGAGVGNVFGGGGGTPPLANRSPGTIAAIAQKVQPAVVSVEIRGQTESGNGSGFVVRQDGYIITNNHVAEPAANGGTLKAVFSDGTSLDATIVGRDPNSDIAVIKVAKTGLVTLPFGDSDKVAVGDPVVAFGSPLDLQGTVTSGIVSALDRPVVTGGDQNGTSTGAEPVYTAALQTDASINPGNSGGPLVDGGGRVVGVDSSIAQVPGSGGKGSIGIGFAIPINLAKRVAGQIIATSGPGRQGTAKRTVMGATLDPADLPNGGVRLKSVQAGGPAQKAGLRDGDVVTRFNGKFIADQVELIALTRKLAAGTSVPVEYVRGGSTVKATIVLAETS
ncbi:S1C family serine protease [Fodinicola acaciae]|uniref:S1C family serine protease n=1 Tax=Fodinicola acaciae TaxID=2681555 RepID=UPI001C9E708D|nr:trypsin-like peptidase domain-containing protein [Fodinicola acaciae]